MGASHARPGITLLAVILALTWAPMVAGCGTWIPPGAQQVRITATSTDVRLEPATVRAGDVYFVVEGSSIMVWHADETSSGGLSDEQAARLAQTGDLQDTGSTELYPGYAGNVYRWTVGPGPTPSFPSPAMRVPTAS